MSLDVSQLISTTQTRLEPAQQRLLSQVQIGQKLAVRVKELLSANQVILSVKGIDLVANTGLPVKAGQLLNVQVAGMENEIVLRVIQQGEKTSLVLRNMLTPGDERNSLAGTIDKLARNPVFDLPSKEYPLLDKAATRVLETLKGLGFDAAKVRDEGYLEKILNRFGIRVAPKNSLLNSTTAHAKAASNSGPGSTVSQASGAVKPGLSSSMNQAAKEFTSGRTNVASGSAEPVMTKSQPLVVPRQPTNATVNSSENQDSSRLQTRVEPASTEKAAELLKQPVQTNAAAKQGKNTQQASPRNNAEPPIGTTGKASVKSQLESSTQAKPAEATAQQVKTSGRTVSSPNLSESTAAKQEQATPVKDSDANTPRSKSAVATEAAELSTKAAPEKQQTTANSHLSDSDKTVVIKKVDIGQPASGKLTGPHVQTNAEASKFADRLSQQKEPLANQPLKNMSQELESTQRQVVQAIKADGVKLFSGGISPAGLENLLVSVKQAGQHLEKMGVLNQLVGEDRPTFLEIPFWAGGEVQTLKLRLHDQRKKHDENAEEGEVRFDLYLDLSDMGRLRVNTNYHKKGVSISFYAENEKVVKMLRKDISELQEALDAEGIRLHMIRVDRQVVDDPQQEVISDIVTLRGIESYSVRG